MSLFYISLISHSGRENTFLMIFDTHSQSQVISIKLFMVNKQPPAATLTCDLQDLNPSWSKIRYRFWRYGLQVFQIIFILLNKINLDKWILMHWFVK